MLTLYVTLSLYHLTFDIWQDLYNFTIKLIYLIKSYADGISISTNLQMKIIFSL